MTDKLVRKKDINWAVRELDNGCIESWEQVQICLLMDLRDEMKALNQELRRLNSLMYCSNTIGIPHTLKRIDKRLATKLPLKKGQP